MPHTPAAAPAASPRTGRAADRSGRGRRRAQALAVAVTAVLTALLGPGPAAAAHAGGTATAAADAAPDGRLAVHRGPSDEARYAPPVPGVPAFARPFRAPAERWSSGHRGLDLWLEVGTQVLSPAAGVVVFAGTVVDRGVVTVLHADGRRTSLEPVTPRVEVGQRVGAGDVLGTLQDGDGHCPARGCLHWGLREGERYLDPMTVLPGGGPVVLLPLPVPA